MRRETRERVRKEGKRLTEKEKTGVRKGEDPTHNSYRQVECHLGYQTVKTCLSTVECN